MFELVCPFETPDPCKGNVFKDNMEQKRTLEKS